MESENIEEISNIFNQIDIEDNSESGNEKLVFNRYKPKPKLRRIFLNPIDFERYVQENCNNKFKILNRLTFHQIRRPIVIFFNHFREKCVYHTKWLDRIYQLALKYGDQIEFIAADISDIDVLYPNCNPYYFYCRMIKPENETPFTYAIDEKKRIHKHQNEYQTVEDLTELCENLLKGNLYPSQPIPNSNEKNLVKICVHNNYEELVLKSSKDILFIVSFGKYSDHKYEPNYENVALQLKDYNLDIIYMQAEVNYVPFEYNAICYPTILFIPHNDKTNFVHFIEPRTEENIISFLKKIIGQPDMLKFKQEEQKFRYNSAQKPLMLPNDFEIDFNELPQFLKENFDKIHVLDRETVGKYKYYTIMVFMNFQGKCLLHHIQWIKKIYTIVESSYSVKYLVADFKDIDIINTKWTASSFLNSKGKPEDEVPKIFAMDHFKHTYELANFTTIASLFYFESSLTSKDLYYSQCYPKNQDEYLVKTCVADSLNIFIKQSKKDLFITFYQSELENSEQLLQVLEDVAKCVKDLNVEVVKYDVTENYVDLEYAYHTYPVHYFIPRHNKNENQLFINNGLNSKEILKFIKKCIK